MEERGSEKKKEGTLLAGPYPRQNPESGTFSNNLESGTFQLLFWEQFGAMQGNRSNPLDSSQVACLHCFSLSIFHVIQDCIVSLLQPLFSSLHLHLLNFPWHPPKKAAATTKTNERARLGVTEKFAFRNSKSSNC